MALIIAPYLGVAPEIILFASLTTAGILLMAVLGFAVYFLWPLMGMPMGIP